MRSVINLEQESRRLTDDVMSKVCDTLAEHCISCDEELFQALCESICDCVLDALHTGTGFCRFPYEVAEQCAKVDIKAEQLAAGEPDMLYFWNMIAGFSDAEEANSYLSYRRRKNPGKEYGGFVDGIPTDYND